MYQHGDKIELADTGGYFAVVQVDRYDERTDYRFIIQDDQGASRLGRMSYDVQVESPYVQYGEVRLARVSYSGMGSYVDYKRLAALGQLLTIVAPFANALTVKFREQAAELIEKARLAAEEAEQKRQERLAALQARRESIKENIQYMLGQKFRLTRYGYRSTVFGTIDHVDEIGFSITTEKDEPMRITYGDLRTFEVKYEGEKRYTPITLPDHPDHDGEDVVAQ